MVSSRNDVVCSVSCTGFCSKDGAFHWKSFSYNWLIQNGCARYFIVVDGAICTDIEVIGLVFQDIAEFIRVSAGIGFCLGELP